MKNKRFTVVIVLICVMFVVPIAYAMVRIYDIDLVTSVIGSMATVGGVYLGGQSISDASREWQNPSDDEQI